jgi:hypothetical protein
VFLGGQAAGGDAVALGAQDPGERLPHGQHGGHLLQQHGLVRPPGIEGLQRPAQRFQDQAGPFVVEGAEVSGDAVPVGKQAGQMQDGVQGGASAAFAADGVRLARRGPDEIGGVGEVAGPEVADVAFHGRKAGGAAGFAGGVVVLDAGDVQAECGGSGVPAAGPREQVDDHAATA